MPVLSRGIFASEYNAIPAPARACAVTVASAAPPTPISRPIINQISRAILTADDAARKTSGTTEFPIALRIYAKKL